MRPVPVPPAIRDAEWCLATQVYAAPDGDLTNPIVPPAEGLQFNAKPSGAPEGTVWPCVGVVLELDAVDVSRIAAGARHIIMAWPGETMPVFLTPWLED